MTEDERQYVAVLVEEAINALFKQIYGKEELFATCTIPQPLFSRIQKVS